MTEASTTSKPLRKPGPDFTHLAQERGHARAKSQEKTIDISDPHFDRKKKMAFVSDVHLFHKKSYDPIGKGKAGKKFITGMLDRLADEVGELNLVGDIIEMMFSRNNPKETRQEAAEWLEDFVTRHADCKINFVLGNHDAHKKLLGKLQTIKNRHANFGVHQTYARTDNIVFLHGDDIGFTPKRGKENIMSRKGPERFSRLKFAVIPTVEDLYQKHISEKLFAPAEYAEKILTAWQNSARSRQAEDVDTFVYGHSHILSLVESPRYRIFNCGSVYKSEWADRLLEEGKEQPDKGDLANMDCALIFGKADGGRWLISKQSYEALKKAGRYKLGNDATMAFERRNGGQREFSIGM